MKTILFLFLLIIQSVIVIIPYQGKLSDNRSQFPKNFTKRGWILVTLCFLTIIITISIFLLSEKENNANSVALKNAILETTNKASTKYSQQLDSNNKWTIELLAKYGLKYDSSQMLITKLIKDSSRKTIIQNEINPTFDFSNEQGVQLVSKSIGVYKFNIISYSFESSTANLNAKVSAIIKLNDGTFKIVSNPIIYGTRNLNIPFKTYYAYEMKLESIYDFEIVYFVLIGTYFNTLGTKKFELNSIRGIDLSQNKYIAPNSVDEEEIRKLLHQVK
jgi:hypothetical protein